jgi:predicted ATP-dependent endonuclease of OLD family
MHLQRVQVPDFRVLKDVDIIFEKDFNPRVFPLGSQNGGGKSTLLQLIFVLLHCSGNSDSFLALKNLLNGFDLLKNKDRRVLAIIDIWDGQNTVELEFFVCKNFIVEQASNTSNRTIKEKRISFSTFTELKIAQKESNNLSNKLKRLQESIKKIGSKHPELLNPNSAYPLDVDSNDSSKLFLLENLRTQLLELDIILETENTDDLDLPQKLEQAKSTLVDRQNIVNSKINYFNSEIEVLNSKLKQANIIYISTYTAKNEEFDDIALLCKAKNLRIDLVEKFLKQLSNKVFLAAPSTQVFLFLSKKSRKSLFSDRNEYYSLLTKSNSKLSGLFTYDFLAVDLLIEYFKTARDRDFRQALETGKYGNSYQNLLKDLEFLLQDKKVNLRSDFSGLTFTRNISGVTDELELEPEDLSHGELKRLSIYIWLKHNNIEDAIVLMDEIDLALHPDWQYRIATDLVEWEPSNQYILATHSYELCQALTPSHVKVLEPKLTERRSD